MEEKTTAASTFQRRHPSFNFQVMGREMVLVLPNSDGSSGIGFSGIPNQPEKKWVYGKLNKSSFFDKFLAYLLTFQSFAATSASAHSTLKNHLIYTRNLSKK